jgi:hypothetical protein
LAAPTANLCVVVLRAAALEPRPFLQFVAAYE